MAATHSEEIGVAIGSELVHVLVNMELAPAQLLLEYRKEREREREALEGRRYTTA